MRKLFGGAFGFVLYHLFFAAAILAVSIMGMTLINYVFTALAIVIAVIYFSVCYFKTYFPEMFKL